MTASPFLEAASGYRDRGWSVIPAHPSTKAPLLHSWRVYQQHAPAAAQLRAWWSRWPGASVGVVTGVVSGLVVLDVDPRNGSDESLRRLVADHGALPETAVAQTGGGGVHLYFAHPGDRRVPCRTHAGGYHGLDLKADGGFVIAPPSKHRSGGRYLWVARRPLAPCPPWLLELAGQCEDRARVAYKAHPSGEAPSAEELPERARMLLRHGPPAVRHRFGRDDAELVDTSPSGVDASLATHLALAGLLGAEIEATVRASRAQAGLPEKRPSYYRATVGRALAVARGRQAS